MDKMKYSVDEIIDDVIKLENLNSKELVYLKKEDLDFDVKENDILSDLVTLIWEEKFFNELRNVKNIY